MLVKSGPLRAKKSLGQCFLVNTRVAEAEAAHADGKVVLELGPGYGVLTRELLKSAKKVIAVEKDRDLFILLSGDMQDKKLKLIHKDFFDATPEELELKNIDIMIANVPYSLSSKTIEWLIDRRMQAVLCLQREFVERMLAQPGNREYSKLSVMSALSLSITQIMDVGRGSFRPMPKVDSEVIYIKPKSVKISEREKTAIGLLMQHKKKTLRNAILDSCKGLGLSKEKASSVAESLSDRTERVFKIEPARLLEIAGSL